MGHLRDSGFQVVAADVSAAELMRIKQQHGVPVGHEGCHTAVIGETVVEGHVPGDVLARYLDEGAGSGGLGLVVPGMPVGSPGMEGGRPQPYEVLTFDATGITGVYERR